MSVTAGTKIAFTPSGGIPSEFPANTSVEVQSPPTREVGGLVLSNSYHAIIVWGARRPLALSDGDAGRFEVVDERRGVSLVAEKAYIEGEGFDHRAGLPFVRIAVIGG